MHPDRIKISKEFHVGGSGEWLSVEIPVGPKEDPIEEFKKAKDILMNAFKAMNPEVQLSIPVKQVELNNATDFLAEIRACKDIGTLKTYAIVAATKTEWNHAYAVRRDELIKPKKKNGKIVMP
jgi:hypothetical protein